MCKAKGVKSAKRRTKDLCDAYIKVVLSLFEHCCFVPKNCSLFDTIVWRTMADL